MSCFSRKLSIKYVDMRFGLCFNVVLCRTVGEARMKQGAPVYTIWTCRPVANGKLCRVNGCVFRFQTLSIGAGGTRCSSSTRAAK